MKNNQLRKAIIATVLGIATARGCLPSTAYARPHLPSINLPVPPLPEPLRKSLPLPVPPIVVVIKPELKHAPAVGDTATKALDALDTANSRVGNAAKKGAAKAADVLSTTVGGVPGAMGNQVLHHGEPPDIGGAIKTSLRDTAVSPILRDEAKFHADLAKEIVGDPVKLTQLADPIGHLEVNAAAEANQLGLVKSEVECKQVANVGVDAATAAADAELGPAAGSGINAASGRQAATACEAASKVRSAPIALQ
jgi:hypothetical protein